MDFNQLREDGSNKIFKNMDKRNHCRNKSIKKCNFTNKSFQVKHKSTYVIKIFMLAMTCRNSNLPDAHGYKEKRKQ